MCILFFFTTGYIHAKSRYAIIEDLGCSLVIESSRLWLATALVPDLLATAAITVVAGKIYRHLNSRVTPILTRHGGSEPHPLSKVDPISQLWI